MYKRNSISTLLCLCLVFVHPTSANSEISLVSGTVVAADGQPLAQVEVTINGKVASTNLEGRFSTHASTTDHYFVALTKKGWYSSFHTFAHADLILSRDSDVLQIPQIIMVNKRPGRAMLAFAGDTMMGRRYLEPLPGELALLPRYHPQKEMKGLLRLVKPYLEIADFTSVNLETILSEDQLPEPLPKSVTFFTHPDIVPALQWAGVDYVALGNNHIFDYRDEGLRLTLDSLNRLGLSYSGAGIDANKARTPYSATINQGLFEFLSYVGWSGNFVPNQVAGLHKGGAAFGNNENVLHDVSNVGKGSVTVMQYHGGLEYQSVPALTEVSLYKKAIDLGADLVLGHHPHVLQGLELYRNRLIAYSLGNFVFDQYIYSTQLSMLLFVWMDEDKFYRAEIVPIYLNGYMPTPATGEISFDIQQRLLHRSDLAELEFKPSGAHIVVLPREHKIKRKRIAVDGLTPGSVVHLKKLGMKPLDILGEVANSKVAYRLGVDLVKRGSFESSGEFGTTDRSWLVSDKIAIKKNAGQFLEATGPSRTGMRTFERAFLKSNPATVTASIRSSEQAVISMYLQRRTMTQSREEALLRGPLSLIGSVELQAGEQKQVNLGFDMPRVRTKGVRLLIDVNQSESGTIELDDLAWIEWRTPWLDTNSTPPGTIQATHLQTEPMP